MLKNYAIDVVHETCIVRFYRQPTLSDVISAIDDSSAIRKFQKRLWIFEEGVDLETDEIMKIGEHCIETWPVPSKVAVVTPDDFSYGLARMHDVFREQQGVETMVFKTEHEAIAWLEKADDTRML